MPQVEPVRKPELTSRDAEAVLVKFRDFAERLRPALHGYCSRMVGSVIDGEDVVQDTLLRAHSAIVTGTEPAEMRFWLFRLAHNCSVDLIRKRRPEINMDMQYLGEIEAPRTGNVLELAMQKESAQAAVSIFAKLPPAQRSAIILKDVLGYDLREIGTLLHMPVSAVKAALHRGRTRLANLAKTPSPGVGPPSASPQLKQFLTMFNRRDWSNLTAMLSEDVHLSQTARAELHGRQQVSSNFFAGYNEALGWRLQEAVVEDQECAAVFECGADKPSYFMLVGWRNGQVCNIRDFRYARYVLKNVEITL